MSISYIPLEVRYRLWGKAAGRCEYTGCNRPLWLDSVTKSEFNSAYIAHIIADSPDGPRGDPILSEKLKADLANLMLMCDEHHRLIDKADFEGHTVERLRVMKEAHERRIEIVAAIGPDKQSHVLLYGANIGEHSSFLSYESAREAMLPSWYPADTNPISLGTINSSLQDRSPQFWAVEAKQLRSKFSELVRPLLDRHAIRHLSAFAFAPQPLLILLGYLISDIPAVEVYQRHREPTGWKWQDAPEQFDYLVIEPETVKGPPALVLALSATINDERVFDVLGEDATIWRITIPKPDNDFLKSRLQALRFRQHMRNLLNRIKARHGERESIHVFPAVPVALAVEFGRIVMPKADLPLKVYDENMTLGGFVHALDLNTHIN